jgi:gliding motility-associated-like protein
MNLRQLILIAVCWMGGWTAASGNHGIFIANQGQWEAHILFKYEFPGGAVFLEAQQITYVLADPEALSRLHRPTQGKNSIKGEDLIKMHAYRVHFDGSKAPETVYGLQKQAAFRNYFIGNNPEHWQGNVATYRQVFYKDLYPGVDLRFYIHREQGLKYDFVVREPEAFQNVKLRFEGVDDLSISAGHLIVNTSVGQVLERPPVSWQTVNGFRQERPSAYRLTGNVMDFQLEGVTKDDVLVIDPSIVFSSFTGSFTDNFGFTATYDQAGNLYAGGIAYGVGYPVTTGAYQSAFSGGIDVSISKFAADGRTLHYSTYLGGTANEQPHSMVVGTNDELIVMGVTGSNNFPTSGNAYQRNFEGGPFTSAMPANFAFGTDLFVTRFNATGTGIVGSTFVGGSLSDGLSTAITFNYADGNRGEVIVDSIGNVLIASSTLSANFPTTPGTFQTVAGSAQHGVLFKLDPQLSQLIWSTYLSGNAADCLNALKQDHAQRYVYVAGGTNSNNLPATTGTFSGQTDGVVAKFDAQTGLLTRLAYNGTASIDINFFVDLDASGRVYLLGQTKGPFPVTPGLYTNTNSSQFLQMMDENLQQTIRSTTIGTGQRNTFDFVPTALMVDVCDNVYLSGWGGNVNFEGSTAGLPVTPDAFQSTTDGSDFYFMVMASDWTSLRYATFFGGNSTEHVDGGTSRFSPDGTIYQAICAGCGRQSFPVMPADVIGPTNNSNNCNLAALKIAFQMGEVQLDVDVTPRRGCAPLTLQIANNSRNAHLMRWDFGDGTPEQWTQQPNKTFLQAGVYNIWVYAFDTLCGSIDSASFEVIVRDNDSSGISFTVDYEPCDISQPAVFNFLGLPSDSVHWDFGDGNFSNLPNPTHRYNQPGIYNVVLSVFDSVCNGTLQYSQTIRFNSRGTFEGIQHDYDYCSNPWEVSLRAPYDGFQIVQWELGNGDVQDGREITYRYSSAGEFTIVLTIEDTICGRRYTESITLSVGDYNLDNLMPNVFTPNGDGVNDFFQLLDRDALTRYPEFVLKIYNRWGNLLYQTRQRSFQWNGTSNNNPLPEGVYFWVIELEDLCGNPVDLNGFVHLSR